MEAIVFSPTDFVALVNQTLEFAYPIVTIEGELSEFKVSKGRWLYFNLKDDVSVVRFFGTIYSLPGPLEDGMKVRVVGSPRLHPKFGFSINVQTISPVGEGAIKKAADLLKLKLEKEGLFAIERKRQLPRYPTRVALVTADTSAAYADFIKIMNERWSGVELIVSDVHVQGDRAVPEIIEAIEKVNMLSNSPEVLVLIRGGGSLEDLAAFNDERLTRAVSASRVPTIVGIGHEVDESLAELAADLRASTPSNAAQLLFPDKKQELNSLNTLLANFSSEVSDLYQNEISSLKQSGLMLLSNVDRLLNFEYERLAANKRLAELFNPRSALKRGYSIVRNDQKIISSIKHVAAGDKLNIELVDGTINVIAEGK